MLRRPILTIRTCKATIIYYSCLANVIDTIRLIYYLGFLIHPGKSVLVPTQRLIFLGFILDSVLMRIYMTPDKVAKVIDLYSNLLSAQLPTIRTVSQVLGYIISTFPGVMFGPLYFRHLECDKPLALTQANWDFDLPMTLSVEAKQELSWWVSSAPHSYNVVSHGQPEVTLTTDASLVGWGCMLGETRTGGSWSPDEKSKHINYLELLAVYLALQSFTPQVTGKHVKVMVDNMTALSDINHMGTGKCKDRHQLVKDIWLWCMEHNVWLTAVHIPGAENIDADLQSRVFNTSTEWTLNKPIFAAAISKLGVSPNIDLFASRLDFQIQPYVSFHPDPGAIAINAFHMSWNPYLSYIFQPFCLISRILQKIQEEKATADSSSCNPALANADLVAAPDQSVDTIPNLLPNTKTTVHLPSNPSHIHPLYPQLHLLICLLSGNPSKTNEFQLQLPTLLSVRGGPGPSSNINLTLVNGNHTVLNGKLIHFVPLLLTE